MWEISELKQNAKAVLSRFGFWTPFLTTLLAGLLMADPDNIISAIDSGYGLENIYENEEYAAIFGTALIFIFVFSFIFNLFIGYPVLVGMNRFFMENRINGSKVERVFWAFKSGNYLNVVKIMFLWDIKILLWSLLFIIPGIIKSYEYFMVPYILAENPKISSKRAFELSKEMTRDEKFNIFLLGLSFIGWILLGVITCGIGLLFMEPYYQATFAELYQVMREKAHSQNFSDFNELPGFIPEQ